MARKRLIAPEFFTHAELYDAEAASGLPLRVAFAGLWTASDRRGLFRWRPRELKLAILPYDTCDFSAVLAALETAGFIERYTADRKEYGRIPSFGTWQTFHPNEKPSDAPEPAKGGPEPTNGRPASETGRRSKSVTGTGTVTSTASISVSAGAERDKRAEEDAEWATLWALYPKRAGGNSERKAQRAWRARRNAGDSAGELRAGLERYAAFVHAAGKEGTEFVMQGATFFGPDDHWREAWEVPPVSPVKGAIGIAPAILGQAATLWPRYRAANLLTRWQRPEYERIGAELVAAGHYADVAAFLDELRVTQPWTLADAKTDGYAINELARRLAAPRKAAS